MPPHRKAQVRAAVAATLAFTATLLSSSCSGSRSEPVASECLSSSDCENGAVCSAGTCTHNDSANVSAVGTVSGAPADVRITASAADDNACKEQGKQGVACTVARGGKLSLIAPEVEGYRFTGWSGGEQCQGTAPKLELVKLSKDAECVAHYVRRLHVGGSIEDDPSLSVVASADHEFASCDELGCEVDRDVAVLLTAPERDGFRLVGFDGEGCGERDGYHLTVTPHEANVVCTAHYAESLTIRGQTAGLPADTAARIEAASVSGGGECEGQLCAIDPGDGVTLTAPTVEGFRFRGWTGDPVCTGADMAVVIESVTTNVLCTADYVARYEVSGVSQGASGAIAASSENLFSSCDGARCQVDQGESVSLVAGTVPGFRLHEWTGPGCAPAGGSSARVENVGENVECTAHYVSGVSVSGTVVNATAEVSASSDSPAADCAHGSCDIEVGGTVSLAAPALPGRNFLGWEGDQGCTSKQLAITLAEVAVSKTCRAVFAARYKVDARVVPQKGGAARATSSAPNARCADAACEVDDGSSVTLAATANARYRFSGWNGGGPCRGSARELPLANVTSSITCNANFVARVSVTGEGDPAAAGSVAATSASTAAECRANSCTVDVGADVSLRATPATGYRFVAWSGCANGATNPLSVEASADDQTCTAKFERITYNVNATAGAGGDVSGRAGNGTCPNAHCVVAHGDSASFTASPETGYEFRGWNGCSSSDQAQLTLNNVTANQNCTANFGRIGLNVRAVADTGGTVSARGPNGNCSNASCGIEYGASVTLTASENQGYSWQGWSGCSNSDNRTITLSNVTSNQTCQANFQPLEYTVTGVVGTSGAGSVSCANGCTVNYGDDVTLDASANTSSGWEFTGWSGCRTSSSARLVLTNVTSNQRCVANYERPPHNLTVVVSPSGAGRATCEQGCSVPYGGSQTVSVTPNGGYQTKSWSCGAGSSNSLTVSNITSDRTCTVTLARNDHIVAVQKSANTGSAGSVSATVNGVACPNNRCVVPDGDSVVLRVNTLISRQIFDGWAGCSPSSPVSQGSGAYQSTLSNVTSDQTCTANLASLSNVSFRVSDSRCAGVQGSAAPSASGVSCNSSSCIARENTTVTILVGFRDVGSGSGCAWNGMKCTGGPAPRMVSSGAGSGTFELSGFSGSQNVDCLADVGMMP